MHRPIDRLPWACIAPHQPKGFLDSRTAESLFGPSHIEYATYSIGTDGYARMHTSLQTGEASNLSHFYTGETVECATRDDLHAFLHRHNAQARCFLSGEIEQLLQDYMPAKATKASRVRTPRKRNPHHDWMIFSG